MPPRRLLNIAHGIISEALAYGEDEAREAFHEAMEWPEAIAVEAESAQDRSARHAAQLIGSDNVDAMVMRAWEAQQRRIATEAAAHAAEGQADEVTP